MKILHMTKNCVVKYNEQRHPGKRVSLVGVMWWDWGLVEAEAGDVGFLLRKRQSVDFDEAEIVRLGLVEGKGEVLDAVLGAELHEEVRQLSQLRAEPFYNVG